MNYYRIMIDLELCKHIWCEKMLLNGILDYVINLSINYVSKNQHVKRTKFKSNAMFEH
jgi:hypothetical protein